MFVEFDLFVFALGSALSFLSSRTYCLCYFPICLDLDGRVQGSMGSHLARALYPQMGFWDDELPRPLTSIFLFVHLLCSYTYSLTSSPVPLWRGAIKSSEVGHNKRPKAMMGIQTQSGIVLKNKPSLANWMYLWFILSRDAKAYVLGTTQV